MSWVCIGYGMPFDDFLAMTKIPLTKKLFWTDMNTFSEGTEMIIGSGGEVITGERGFVDLFSLMGDGHATNHIMMFPTRSTREKWHFWSERIADFVNPVVQLAPATYLDTPFVQYNCYMDGNGVEVASPGGDPALVPGIPPVMRDWLIRYKVLDLAGVAKLRPLLTVLPHKVRRL